VLPQSKPGSESDGLAAWAITNMLLLLGDVFVPGPPFFLTNHASYFEHATITILLAFLVGAFTAVLPGHITKLRIALVLAICFRVNGLFLAEGGYRRNLPSTAASRYGQLVPTLRG